MTTECKTCLYFYNLALALDQLGSAVLGGDPDETISSRLGKAKAGGQGWAKAACWVLHLFDANHCRWSREQDEGSAAVWRWYETPEKSDT